MNARLLGAVEFLQKFTRTQFLVALASTWVFALYLGEWGTAHYAMARCSWPELPSNDKDTVIEETRLALVADPQIIDENTYPGRPGWLLKISEWITDRYLARHWRLLNSVVDPDSFVFLGDLFDGGREWEDEKWMQELERYDQIFKLPPNKRVLTNVPGNHDIGYGEMMKMAPRYRFEAVFGASNNFIDLEAHELVFLDTPSFAAETTMGGERPKAANEFIKHMAGLRFKNHFSKPRKTRVLFTHVPLFRLPNADCGPVREKRGPLPFAKGRQYMTQLDPDLTTRALDMIQPDLIFTGDDHDFCRAEHQRLNEDGGTSPAPEFTIKSASMAMGIHKPAVQLLTLGSDGSWSTGICYQADPFHPLVGYGLLAIISLALVVMRCWGGGGKRARSSSVGSLPTAEYSPLDKPSRKQSSLLLQFQQASGDIAIILAVSIGFVVCTHYWTYAPL